MAAWLERGLSQLVMPGLLVLSGALLSCADPAATPDGGGDAGGAGGTGAGGEGGGGLGGGSGGAEGGSGGEASVPACSTATDCEDHVACTIDLCVGGECTHERDSNACEPGDLCHDLDGCRPASGWLCRGCQSEADCRREGDACVALGASSACLPACGTDAACPAGFACVDVVRSDGASARACRPADDVCCWDRDGDGAGVGSACAAPDCDEEQPGVHPGAQERCNGIDDDCDGRVDVGAVDAPPSSCAPSGDGFATIAFACGEAGWVEAAASSCGEASCEVLESGASTCATRCLDDAGCRSGAQCDPVLQLCIGAGAGGARCFDDAACSSGHCEAGVCCPAGESCCPVPGSEEQVDCGPDCGLGDRARICTADFTWSGWGACRTDWSCQPGSTRLCSPCGSQGCNECGRWNECVNGVDDTVVKDRGNVGENAVPLVLSGWINEAYGWDVYRITFIDEYGVAMRPSVRLLFSYGEAYELVVFWRLNRDGIWNEAPRQLVYCDDVNHCTLPVDIASPDTWGDWINDDMALRISIHKVSGGARLFCDAYTLTLDA